MNNIPINREHLEALQAEDDKKLEDFLKDHPEDKKKYDIIKKCLNELTEAGIPTAIFPFMTNINNPDQKCTYYEHNFNDFVSFDDSDLISKESSKLIYQILGGIYVSLLTVYRPMHRFFDPNNQLSVFDGYVLSIYKYIQDEYQRLSFKKDES